MQLYCGIDLHSNNSLISIVDADDKIVAEQRLNNTISGIQSYLEPFQQAIQGIVVESTYNWYWLVDSMVDQGNSGDRLHNPQLLSCQTPTLFSEISPFAAATPPLKRTPPCAFCKGQEARLAIQPRDGLIER